MQINRGNERKRERKNERERKKCKKFDHFVLKNDFVVLKKTICVNEALIYFIFSNFKNFKFSNHKQKKRKENIEI